MDRYQPERAVAVADRNTFVGTLRRHDVRLVHRDRIGRAHRDVSDHGPPKIADAVSALLVIVAVPLMRPFIFGERISLLADALVMVAALLSLIADKGNDRRLRRSDRALLFWVCLLWLWMLVTTAFKPHQPLDDLLRGVVNVPLTLGAAVLVLREERRRIWIAKGLLALVLLVCISYVASQVFWLVRGFSTGLVTRLPASYKTLVVPTYFPFTTTLSQQPLLGQSVPRFLGLGREPGIMAALAAWSFFALPRVGWSRAGWRALALVGMLATLSTAGFGVFLVVLVMTSMFAHSGPLRPEIVLRQFIGVAAMGGAVWLAIFVPTFGLAAKAGDINPESFSARFESGKLGLAAILNHPLGQDHIPGNGSAINLVAAIALIGVPGFLLATAAFWSPWRHSLSRREAFAPVSVLYLTILLAQPLIDSIGFLLLVALSAPMLATDGADRKGDPV